MSVHYGKNFKKEIVKAYMAGDKSIPQLAVEFNVAESSVSKWVNEYKEECPYTTNITIFHLLNFISKKREDFILTGKIPPHLLIYNSEEG